MAADSDTTSFISSKSDFTDETSVILAHSKHLDVRDYDSLNNLMFNESDNDSVINGPNSSKVYSANCREPRDGNSYMPSKRESDSAGNQCECDAEETRNALPPKMKFKEELDKHRNLVKRDLAEGTRASKSNYKQNSKKSIWRSFISLCVGLLFSFMAFMPLRNIQTSLYPRHHAGNISLAAMYFSFAVGCLFSSWITQNARPKGIILVALFGHVIYCTANIYPHVYSLVPSACFFGFFHAPLWSTQELMIASYGASYTAVTDIGIDKAIHQFQGVFLVFCHAAQIFGNLIESVILHLGDYDGSSFNVSVYHSPEEYALYNNHLIIKNVTEYTSSSKKLVWLGPFGHRVPSDSSFVSRPNYENVIKFVFTAFSLVGMTIVCLFLNKPDIIVHKKKVELGDRLLEVVRFLKTGTFVALFLLMLFTGMQQAVVIGNVTKNYGSLTLGVSMVGYMMMCYGTCQLAVLLLMEKIHQRLRPTMAVFNAFLVSLGLLVWLYIWEPSSSNTYKIMGYVGLWGAVDGLWQSQVQCILMSWSIGRKEAAVTVFRTVQSLGLVLVFVLDIWLSLLNVICICGGILVFGVIFYLILEVVRTPMSGIDPPPFAL